MNTIHAISARRGLVIRGALAFLLATGAAGCTRGKATDSQDWRSYGNRYDEQHFSALKQISDANVAGLKVDWETALPDAVSFTSTPLEVDGVLYFTGDRAIVRAVDARTGARLWTFDPESYEHQSRRATNGWNANRGLAYLDGRIFFGAIDGRLIALDAKSGTKIWETQTFVAGQEDGKALTGAPRAFGNIVVIGFGGAEYGARGDVSAYAADTGKFLWRFYTVPGDPAKPDNAASDDIMPTMRKTWFGDYWKFGGGGTVWGSMTYDAELDQLYLGVGNAGPWDYKLRSQGQGDNLFVSSIVALNPHTGKYLWHYQANPGERWDYKATPNIVLADTKIEGVDRKVLMQAHSNGFFYIIDRTNGKLLSAKAFSKVTWASGVDLQTGRPIMTPEADYDKTGISVLYPGTYGAHNWQPMSYNPQTGLVYIPETQQPTQFTSNTEGSADHTNFDNRPNFLKIASILRYVTVDPAHDGKGSLVAWDPLTQKARWTVPYDSFWNSGTLTTGGNLVFQGTGDGWFRAFNATTGSKLWEVDAQRGITSAPITYSIDGKQHIALLVGYGGLSTFGEFTTKYRYKYKDAGIRLISFSLEGKQALQRLTTRSGTLNPVDTGSAPINAALAARGGRLYHNVSCAVCHGLALDGGSSAPDLRESAVAQHYDSLRTILHDGPLARNGMPQFSDLSDDEIKSLAEYITQQTRAASAPQVNK